MSEEAMAQKESTAVCQVLIDAQAILENAKPLSSSSYTSPLGGN